MDRSTKRVKLVEGTSWVEVEPLVGTIATVVDGNVHRPNDLVCRPETIGWDEAVAPKANGDTMLSPFDLETLYDTVTGWCFIPQSNEAVLDVLKRLEVSSTAGEDDEDEARKFADLVNDEEEPQQGRQAA